MILVVVTTKADKKYWKVCKWRLNAPAIKRTKHNFVQKSTTVVELKHVRKLA
jgi:hypothetical protein